MPNGLHFLCQPKCQFAYFWSWRVVCAIWLRSHQDLHANTYIFLHFSQFMMRRQKRYQPYGPWEHMLSSNWAEEEASKVDEQDDDTSVCQVCGKRDSSECSTCEFHLCSSCMLQHTCETEVPKLPLIYFHAFFNTWNRNILGSMHVFGQM